jgi:hypothetical protein
MNLNEDIFPTALRVKERFSVGIPSSECNVISEVTELIMYCTLLKSLAPLIVQIMYMFTGK